MNLPQVTKNNPILCNAVRCTEMGPPPSILPFSNPKLCAAWPPPPLDRQIFGALRQYPQGGAVNADGACRFLVFLRIRPEICGPLENLGQIAPMTPEDVRQNSASGCHSSEIMARTSKCKFPPWQGLAPD